MPSKRTLLKLLTCYAYMMLAITSLFLARSVTRHYRQMHMANPAAPAADVPGEDGQLPPREVNPFLGWNEATLVLPFMLLYSIAAYCLTTSPFPSKKKKDKAAAKPDAAPEAPQQVDHYNRRTIGASCVVVASFLFLVLLLSFFVQDKLENQMMMGEDAYRRDQEQQEKRKRRQGQPSEEVDAAAAEPTLQLEPHTGEQEGGAEEEAGEEGQCSAGGDMSQMQIVMSSFDVLFDLVYSIMFGNNGEEEDSMYRPTYKKADPDQNSYYYNFASIQRTDVMLLHVGGLLFSLYTLIMFDAVDTVPAAAPGREAEPQERRDNPALTMDALKQLGAGAAVPRGKKAELLAKNDDTAAKKKQ